MSTRQDIREQAGLLRDKLSGLWPFINLVTRRWARSYGGAHGTGTAVVARDLWQLCLRICTADGRVEKRKLEFAVLLLEALLAYPEADRGDVRAWARQTIKDLAAGTPFRFESREPPQSPVCLALVAQGPGWPCDTALGYASVLFEIGYLVARSDGDPTDAELRAILAYIPLKPVCPSTDLAGQPVPPG